MNNNVEFHKRILKWGLRIWLLLTFAIYFLYSGYKLYPKGYGFRMENINPISVSKNIQMITSEGKIIKASSKMKMFGFDTVSRTLYIWDKRIEAMAKSGSIEKLYMNRGYKIIHCKEYKKKKEVNYRKIEHNINKMSKKLISFFTEEVKVRRNKPISSYFKSKNSRRVLAGKYKTDYWGKSNE